MKKYSKSIILEEEYKIDFLGKTFNVLCQYKRCKYIKMKIVNQDTILVIVFSKPSKKLVEEILNRNSEKIAKLLNTPKQEISNDEFLIFGKKYNKSNYSNNEINKLYNDAFQEIITMFNSIQVNNNFPKVNLYFRKMRSRWGVCYPTLKKIGLSSYLVSVPKYLIEYVIYHEFCHLKFANHSKDFYDELSKYSKNYKEYRKELKYYNSLL